MRLSAVAELSKGLWWCSLMHLQLTLAWRQTGWSTEEKARLHRHAAAHVPRLSAAAALHPRPAHSALLRGVLSLLVCLLTLTQPD